MKIVNKTHWRTADLARIARKVVRAEFPKATYGSRAQRIVVEVNYNRVGTTGTYSTGHAWINGNTIRIHVPSGAIDPVEFAWVVAHEAGHCKGYKHTDEKFIRTLHWHGSGYTRTYFAWAKEMPIRRQEVKRKIATTDTKLQHARQMLEKAQTRLKRAKTIEAKWRQKVKYYERRTKGTGVFHAETTSEVHVEAEA